jgi:hypothetical protein
VTHTHTHTQTHDFHRSYLLAAFLLGNQHRDVEVGGEVRERRLCRGIFGRRECSVWMCTVWLTTVVVGSGCGWRTAAAIRLDGRRDGQRSRGQRRHGSRWWPRLAQPVASRSPQRLAPPPLLCVGVQVYQVQSRNSKKSGSLGKSGLCVCVCVYVCGVCGCARGWVGVRGCAWVRRRASACVCVCAAVQSSKDAWLGLSTLSLVDIKVFRCEG